MTELRVLNEEEIIDLVTEYHLSGEKNRHILSKSVAAKQHQADLKAFIEMIESNPFYREWSGVESKIHCDFLLYNLRQKEDLLYHRQDSRDDSCSIDK